MSLVSSIASTATSLLPGTTSGGNSNLQQFLDTFQNESNRYNAFKLDPYNNFTLKFEFTPDGKAEEADGFWMTLGKGIAGSFMNELGGIGDAIMDTFGNDETQFTSYNRKSSDNSTLGNSTILNYARKGSFLDGGVHGYNTVKTGSNALDLTTFIQNVSLPNIIIPDQSTSTTLLGNFSVNGTMVDVENHNFNIDILNTKLPLIETLFYPWMREITMPYWNYDNFPYTTAKVTIDLSLHADVKYILYGVKPTKIQSYNPSQALNTNITRFVTFIFDYMCVTSTAKGKESYVSSIMGGIKSLATGLLP